MSGVRTAFESPVSSSRVTKQKPFAEPGRWRTIAWPAVRTRRRRASRGASRRGGCLRDRAARAGGPSRGRRSSGPRDGSRRGSLRGARAGAAGRRRRRWCRASSGWIVAIGIPRIARPPAARARGPRTASADRARGLRPARGRRAVRGGAPRSPASAPSSASASSSSRSGPTRRTKSPRSSKGLVSRSATIRSARL